MSSRADDAGIIIDEISGLRVEVWRIAESLDEPSRIVLATRILCAMLTTCGMKESKVQAAYEYADLLLAGASK